MSQNEEKLLDEQGRFLQVVKDGHKRKDVNWIRGRILLSDQRVVLAANQGKRTVPISAITKLGGRYDVNQAVARIGDYVSLHYEGENVLLVTAPTDSEQIEDALYQAILDNNTVLARHPAVEGGVVQETDWHKAQLKYDEESVILGLADGTFAEIELDDISDFGTAEQVVRDKDRSVLKVEHTTEDSTSIQTHVSGSGRHVQVLNSLFRDGHQQSALGVDLEQHEQQVLMALYTGISPFEIPEFVGMDVEKVEETYERLIELDALEEVRMRREVDLTARGRQIAGGAMDNE
jgi:hypothetical protein